MFFSLVSIARAGLCGGEDGEGDVGMAATAVLTQPSLFFTADHNEEDEVCVLCFRCGGPSSSPYLVAP